MEPDDNTISQILSLIDEKPLSKSAIRSALKIGDHRANACLDRMLCRGDAVKKLVGPVTMWHSRRLWVAMYGPIPTPKPAMDTVTLPDRARWVMPAAEVSYLDGVKITRQPAPKGRYHVDIPAGGGVISRDWAATRAAQ